ncbi:MAG TPA: helix-turn-helix domain-containing protein [Candidatus Binatia bacterium]
MPFCHAVLTAQKPKDSAYPKELKTLGDHIRKRRLELGLFQKHVAKQIGVDEATVFNWESNETQSRIRHIPRIIEFLGYNPLSNSEGLSNRLLAARMVLGFTQRDMARRLGVDPTTILLWETRKRRPSRKLLRIVEEFLSLH